MGALVWACGLWFLLCISKIALELGRIRLLIEKAGCE